MAVEDEFVQIRRLLWREPVEAQVIEDEQVGGEEGPEGAVDGVVHSGLCHGLEEVVGVAEADGVSGADGGVAQGLSSTLRKIHKEQWMSPLWGGTTCGRCRKVFDCPQLRQTFENSRVPLSSILNRHRS